MLGAIISLPKDPHGDITDRCVRLESMYVRTLPLCSNFWDLIVQEKGGETLSITILYCTAVNFIMPGNIVNAKIHMFEILGSGALSQTWRRYRNIATWISLKSWRWKNPSLRQADMTKMSPVVEKKVMNACVIQTCLPKHQKKFLSIPNKLL